MSHDDHPAGRRFSSGAQARRRRMLNNLPLAHRLAAGRTPAVPEGASSTSPRPTSERPTPERPASQRPTSQRSTPEREQRLGRALVGLVEAADSYDEAAGGRFGAYAEPRIVSALARDCDEAEIARAQAEIAAAISSQSRVRALADFLDVSVPALVGGLMDATRLDPDLTLPDPPRGAG